MKNLNIHRCCSYSGFNILIAKVCAATSVDEIFHLLSHDHACNAVQISHSIIDKLLYQFKDDGKSALGVFKRESSHPSSKSLPESYDMMVDILGKAKQIDKIKKLVDEMRQTHLVTLSTIAKVMRRLVGAEDWKDAVRTFDDLGTFGLE
ncbi:Pentatricopeptide repeat-containing protein [Camellia lanceoleosa]|uniref:Pentatricopeptide repeat-containing protein n=1 Tax=Camellia lanceoleosa TaxID=1840588 RepID=A0ACC0HMV8_9ERIC|nr:Pentatricopeptide repeat-containing protein [Camellia lanceoleosa]